MLPAVALAKAVPLMKLSAVLLARWRTMPPESRALVNDQAGEVIHAANLVRRGVGGRVINSLSADIPDWDSALQAALSPDAGFLMAHELVGALRTKGPLTEDELAAEVHAVGTGDSTFRQAVATAKDDEHIERKAGKWRLTTLSDGDLVDSPHVLRLEDDLCAELEQRGLAYREVLAQAVGVPKFSSPEFQAALERAMFAGRVAWTSPRVYSLPLARLQAFAKPNDVDSSVSEQVDVKRALKELGAATAQFGKAIGAARAMTPDPNASHFSPDYPVTAVDNAATRLREIEQLHVEGAITSDEYASKRAEILARI